MSMHKEISIAFQTNKTPKDYIALARQVNQYAFDAISVYNDAPFHPAYAALLLMAPYIERARIGPATVQPSRIHPIDIAAQAVLLEQLAPGRTYIGLSRGAWLQDHGIREDHKPITAMRDAIHVIRYMLSGERGGYKGEAYHLAEHVVTPYPLPETAKNIPILIGTWGQKMGELAGELADEVKIGGSANPDIVHVVADYIAAGEVKVGREIGSTRIVMGAVSVVDEDRSQARALARREVALYLPVVAALDPTLQIDPELISLLQMYVNQKEFDIAGQMISDDLLDRFAFSGAPNDIIQQCERLFASGVQRIELGTPHGVPSHKGVRLLGEIVLPALNLPQ